MTEDAPDGTAGNEQDMPPFSDRSRAALETATQQLITALTSYLDTVRDLPSGLSDDEFLDLVSPANEAVGEAVHAWNGAAGDHARAAQDGPPEEGAEEVVLRDQVGPAVHFAKPDGVPYGDVPGVELYGGRTVYLVPDPAGPDPRADLADLADFPGDLRPILPPTGRIDFSEVW